MYRERHLSTRYYIASLALGLTMTAPVLAQQPGPPQIDRRTNPERARQQDMSKREWQLRNPGAPPAAPPDRKQLEALMDQIEQDFNRILLRHNEIVRMTSSDRPLEYGIVSDATGEIRKRASRLQSTLALGEAGAEKKNTEGPSQLNDLQVREALLTLCRSIKSFVTNPVIQTPGTIHLEHLQNARRDLAEVIKLSSHISENAERLGKP